MTSTDLRELEPRRWPLVLSVREVQHLTGLSRGGVLKLVDEGVLESVVFGSLRRHQVSRRSVMALLGAALSPPDADEAPFTARDERAVSGAEFTDGPAV